MVKKKKLLKTFKKLFSSRKRAAIIVVLIILTGFIGQRVISNNKDEKVQPQTTQVERGMIISSVSASGSIISSNIENVTTQASGTVSKVYVSDGDEVYVGQKLAEIDLDVQGEQNHASAYSSYLSAVNSANSANNSYRSTQASLAVVYDEIKGHDDDESLEMKETRTKAEVANDNAYDSVKSAKAKLTSASLAYKTNAPAITAPVAGIVKSVTVAEGMNIGAEETASGGRANQRIATIATEGLPIATFNVSEIDVSSIKPGQKATITLDSITNKTFTGKVVSVDRVGTIANNVTTYPVIIQFDTNSDQILPNMAVTANIVIERKDNALLVPSGSVQSQGEQSFVSVLVGGKPQPVSVEIGLSSDTQTEIVSGLNEGDIIITGAVSTDNNQDGDSPFGGGAGSMLRMVR
ncbi:efflux RND transporter periplasmic adaptor subunit [Candidatus Shapirobacteria bacterium]|nr:efflux RND transporter periplasmic adaptor subunit [Candidatus Shapirobacteria bacterium]